MHLWIVDCVPKNWSQIWYIPPRTNIRYEPLDSAWHCAWGHKKNHYSLFNDKYNTLSLKCSKTNPKGQSGALFCKQCVFCLLSTLINHVTDFCFAWRWSWTGFQVGWTWIFSCSFNGVMEFVKGFASALNPCRNHPPKDLAKSFISPGMRVSYMFFLIDMHSWIIDHPLLSSWFGWLIVKPSPWPTQLSILVLLETPRRPM